MKRLYDNRVRTALIAVVAASVLGSGSAKADFTFGEPVNFGPVINSEAREYSHCVSGDGLELYFGSDREGGSGGVDLWMTTRATTEDAWGEPSNLGSLVNSANWDIGPAVLSALRSAATLQVPANTIVAALISNTLRRIPLLIVVLSLYLSVSLFYADRAANFACPPFLN